MLGDFIAATLPELRAEAESLMVDTCTITRGGTSTWDADLFRYTTSGGETVYEGNCRVQSRNVQPSSPEAGDAVFTALATIIQLPVAVAGIRLGDTFTLDASDLDVDLIGTVCRVVGLVRKTHATMRRLVCEEIQS